MAKVAEKPIRLYGNCGRTCKKNIEVRACVLLSPVIKGKKKGTARMSDNPFVSF
ncbi:hypothetical protein JCM6292_861 [Bacteroides pyogenes JCM 6292]|uniref:Uncharacterized protein n=2 Tax=Bacteroides pyogenes TaxID=310300 RepID=W4PF13_9BACE|nr:hypothetical protein JCM6292_861 [Bacteroides pyogenes JCM 6292]GAE18367.1 hypothetical protein JCM6294_1252 [Bacteroides pyogenes DSM 20611 = JCM 6294]